MGNATKNYSDAGGDRLVIGGILEVKEGAKVSGVTKPLAFINTETLTVPSGQEGIYGLFIGLLNDLKEKGYMLKTETPEG